MINNNDFSINLPRRESSMIMVMGVGGAGGNAVNHMYDLGIEGVTFVVCNTDSQALKLSPVDLQIQLGEGLGAGNDPQRGRKAAVESLDSVVKLFEEQHTRMIFITAGMGGGTGTGAAPVIAKAAKEHGILTVGIVTLPFRTEGQQRVNQAREGLNVLIKNVDSYVVIYNDNLSKIYGSLPFREAFSKADDILATAAKGIAELITRTGGVNVDFADVKNVMTDSGMSVMGSACAEGPNKVDAVVDMALSSPLLNQRDIRGAGKVLCNLTYGSSFTMDEAALLLKLIQKRASTSMGKDEANIIWGAGEDMSLGEKIELIIVATKFGKRKDPPDPNDPNHLISDEHSIPDDHHDDEPDDDEPDDEGLVIAEKHFYDNIDQAWKQPSYIARGLTLTPFTGRFSGVQVKESDEPEKESGENVSTGSLF